MSARPDWSRLPVPLRELGETLYAERDALIANDADALMRAADAKLKQLKAFEASPLGRAGALDGFDDELRTLAQLNIANGALIARRRSEATWTLQQLGLHQPAGAYDERGTLGVCVAPRARAKA